MKDMKKLDLDNLDAIIRKCEDAMVGKFKKKEAASEPEEEPMDEEEEVSEEGSDDGQEKPDLSDMDLEDLMKLYSEMKDREGEE